MATFASGPAIKRLRESRNMTQEELSENICSVSTISKIENGLQTPSKEIFEMLMQRLGHSAENYICVFLSDHEYRLKEMKTNLKIALVKKDYTEAKRIIDILEKEESFTKSLNLQFLLSSKASIASSEGDFETTFELLNRAIRITIPNFSIDNIKDYHIVYEEIIIIQKIALAYFQTGEHDISINILYALKYNLETQYVDEAEKSRTYPQIVYNLSKALGLEERHEESIAVCEDGKKICIRTHRLEILAKLIYNMAVGYHLIGNDDVCVDMLKQSYYILKATERYRDAKIAKEYAEHEFGISF